MRNSWQIKIVGFSFLLFSGISLSEPLIVDQTTLSEDLPLGFAIPDDVHTVIVDRINQSRPDIEVSNLRRSPAKGLYRLTLMGKVLL